MSIIKFFLYFLLFLFGNKFIKVQNLLSDLNLIHPEAWSIYGSVDNFNIAFPDVGAKYRGSFICIKKGETITLESEVPNARYYSIQVYDSSTASLGSLNDHQIQIINGKFSINITRPYKSYKPFKTNNKNNTLYVSTEDSLLILLYRVYDVSNETKSKNKIESFGWIELPKLYKYSTIGSKTNITAALTYTKIGFPYFYTDSQPVKPLQYANTKNNFFKPHSDGYFSNRDASYLVSTIQLYDNKTNKTIGAIIKGYLPLVSVTRANFFKSNNYTCFNFDYKNNSFYGTGYYEVRYVSFNMGIGSSPYPTVAGSSLKSLNGHQLHKYNLKHISSTGKPGIMDTDIIRRYRNSKEWHQGGRPYTIYIGMNVSHIWKLGGNPNVDLYLTYPLDYVTGIPFTYPVILFRHLMSQDKFMTEPNFTHGIGSINKNFATPSECQVVMQKYYPTIKFIYA